MSKNRQKRPKSSQNVEKRQKLFLPLIKQATTTLSTLRSILNALYVLLCLLHFQSHFEAGWSASFGWVERCPNPEIKIKVLHVVPFAI